jgi:predicted DNA-binding transcriptional regulator YafY
MKHTGRRAHRYAASALLAAAALGTVALHRHILDRAADTGHAVRIAYVKESGEPSVRLIHPERAVQRSKAGRLYVRAHDTLRDAARSFRLDRITALETA